MKSQKINQISNEEEKFKENIHTRQDYLEEMKNKYRFDFSLGQPVEEAVFPPVDYDEMMKKYLQKRKEEKKRRKN